MIGLERSFYLWVRGSKGLYQLSSPCCSYRPVMLRFFRHCSKHRVEGGASECIGIGNDVFEYWISYYFGAFMIYALDLRAIWLLPVFRVDIPADRLSFVLEGKQNACWFYSNRQITTTASHTDEDQRKRIYNERVQLLINGNLLDSEMESSVFSSLVSG